MIFSDLSLWPSKIRLQNYVDGWRGAALPFSTFFMNSFIVSCLAWLETYSRAAWSPMPSPG